MSTRANDGTLAFRSLLPFRTRPSNRGRQCVVGFQPRSEFDSIVENRPGAGGTLGATAMLAAKPDGYTITQLPLGVFRIPHIQKTDYDRWARETFAKEKVFMDKFGGKQ